MGINWKYFFGGSGGNTFDRYYKAEINGQRVEKHASNRGVEYSIGNMDEAKERRSESADISRTFIKRKPHYDKVENRLIAAWRIICEHFPDRKKELISKLKTISNEKARTINTVNVFGK